MPLVFGAGPSDPKTSLSPQETWRRGDDPSAKDRKDVVSSTQPGVIKEGRNLCMVQIRMDPLHLADRNCSIFQLVGNKDLIYREEHL